MVGQTCPRGDRVLSRPAHGRRPDRDGARGPVGLVRAAAADRGRASPGPTCRGCRACTCPSEVVLLGLLPPLLYAAAIQTSLVDFNANRRPILLLSVGLVVFTAAGVGVVVHACLPDLGWPAAFAIGAVVAPPDAVAATAIARKIGLPRRIVTILEGESLLNDATALVTLRTAIARQRRCDHSGRRRRDFLRAAGGGLLFGLVTFKVVALVRRKRHRPAAGHGDLVRDAVRGLHRGREGARVRGVRRSSSPACCSATRRRSCRPPSRGSTSG